MKKKKLPEENVKVIKINGIKTKVILPKKLDPKEIPNKVESEENHPSGLFLPA